MFLFLKQGKKSNNNNNKEYQFLSFVKKKMTKKSLMQESEFLKQNQKTNFQRSL